MPGARTEDRGSTRAGSDREPDPEAAVKLYWLPLGAGGHSVRWNGRIYERLTAAIERRPALALYHAALEVRIAPDTYVIEQAPEPDLNRSRRGVVVEGPVGARWAGRFRTFRYEVRLWRGGTIADLSEAVDSPRWLTTEPRRSREVLEAVADVPPLVWGRDERGTGEMWNSNSVIAWILSSAGIDAVGIDPPTGGRAPGWDAGILVAGG